MGEVLADLRKAFDEHYRVTVYIKREGQEVGAAGIREIACWGYVSAIDDKTATIGPEPIDLNIIEKAKRLKEYKRPVRRFVNSDRELKDIFDRVLGTD